MDTANPEDPYIPCIEANSLRLGERLGGGAYGAVFAAELIDDCTRHVCAKVRRAVHSR